MKKKMNGKLFSAVILSAVLVMQGQAALAAEFSDGSSFGYAESYSPFTSSDQAVWEEQVPVVNEMPAAAPEETAVFSEAEEESKVTEAKEITEAADAETFAEEETTAEEKSAAEEKPEAEEVNAADETINMEVGTEEAGLFDSEEFQQEVYKTDFLYEDTEVLVSAKALEEAQLPLNTEMKVVKLLEGTPEFEAAKSAAEAEFGVNENAEYIFYDVAFEIDGQEIEPADGMVTVRIEFKTIQKKENTDDQGVIHIDETETGNIVKDITASTEAGNNMSSVNSVF